MRLYFIGGEDIKKRDSEAIMRRAVTGKVLVFPWSRQKINPDDPYRTILTDYITDLGGTIEFAKGDIESKVKHCDTIYLPGGNSRILIERLMPYKELLKGFDGVIIGNSAGAHAMCSKYIGLIGHDSRDQSEIGIGLGLVDFAVVVHYDPSEDQEIRRIKGDLTVYGIPEGSALYYDGKIEFIGNIQQQ